MKHCFAKPLILLFVLSLTACSANKVSISTVSDIEGKTIGCQAGTTGESFLCDNFKAISVQPFRTANEACLSLKNKKLDAVIIDLPLASHIVQENNDLEIVDLNLLEEFYGFAVKKGNKELLDSINNTIKKLTESGTYSMLIKSFLPLDGNIIIPEIEMLKTKEVVRMGTNASFPPFDYTNGTEVVGFDASISKYIANDYGKRLQIIDMAFNSLIDALNNGTIDFIAAGMSINEERKQIVDFSDPYFSTKQVLIIRK